MGRAPGAPQRLRAAQRPGGWQRRGEVAAARQKTCLRAITQQVGRNGPIHARACALKGAGAAEAGAAAVPFDAVAFDAPSGDGTRAAWAQLTTARPARQSQRAERRHRRGQAALRMSRRRTPQPLTGAGAPPPSAARVGTSRLHDSGRWPLGRQAGASGWVHALPDLPRSRISSILSDSSRFLTALVFLSYLVGKREA